MDDRRAGREAAGSDERRLRRDANEVEVDDVGMDKIGKSWECEFSDTSNLKAETLRTRVFQIH